MLWGIIGISLVTLIFWKIHEQRAKFLSRKEHERQKQRAYEKKHARIEKLAQHGQPVFDESLLAPGAQCWTHDLEDEPLSFVDYWTAMT